MWVEVDTHGMLFDAGISHKALKDRLGDINKTFADDIREVFISHEHGDHNKAVKLIKKNYSLIDFFHQCGGGRRNVHTVPLQHDAGLICCGDIVKDNEGIKLAYIPDTKDMSEEALGMLFDCSVLIFEFNYEIDMLINDCPYPDELKQRIAETHMENSNAGRIISCLTEEGKDNTLKYLVPFHLSQNNNTPNLADFAARNAVHKECRVVVAEEKGWGYVLTVL